MLRAALQGHRPWAAGKACRGKPVTTPSRPLPPVVVLCMHSALLGGLEQTALLSRAWARGLADGRLVFLPYDTMLFALPYRNHSYLALSDSGPLREVYDAVLTVSLESGPTDKSFEAAMASGEAATHLEPEQVGLSKPSQGPECGAVGGLYALFTHSRPSWSWSASRLPDSAPRDLSLTGQSVPA